MRAVSGRWRGCRFAESSLSPRPCLGSADGTGSGRRCARPLCGVYSQLGMTANPTGSHWLVATHGPLPTVEGDATGACGPIRGLADPDETNGPNLISSTFRRAYPTSSLTGHLGTRRSRLLRSTVWKGMEGPRANGIREDRTWTAHSDKWPWSHDRPDAGAARA